ncbi:MAG: hypothetical protein R3302_07105, partial [Sulfurimonadaceae bacterium]|nr:hypothetical protein [Sulfurimonadaceae bacterium]
IQDDTSVAYSIFGSSTDSTLTGTDNNEYISSDSGTDIVNAGGGDDFLVFDSADSLINGGTGYDTLLVSESGALDFGNVQNIEEINMSGGTVEDISHITVDDVFSMTDDDNTLIISGDSGSDAVHLFNENSKDWTQGTAENIGGKVYDVYSYTDAAGTTTVKIQQDLNHDIQPS